jgi:hypothetical protein
MHSLFLMFLQLVMLCALITYIEAAVEKWIMLQLYIACTNDSTCIAKAISVPWQLTGLLIVRFYKRLNLETR